MPFLSKYSTVTGDTHAASLTDAGPVSATNADSNGLVAEGTTNAVLFADTNENTVGTTGSITVPATPNRVFLACRGIVQKTTNSGTVTVRIKQSTTELASVTTAALNGALNNVAKITLNHEITDATAGATTYNITAQASTDGVQVCLFLVAYAVGGSLTGSEGVCSP